MRVVHRLLKKLSWSKTFTTMTTMLEIRRISKIYFCDNNVGESKRKKIE